MPSQCMISTAPLLRIAPVLLKPVVGLMKAYAKLFKPRFFTEKRMGGLYLLDQLNGVDRHLMARGQWESEQVEHLIDLTKKSNSAAKPAVFLDIGSHCGLYAVLMAQSQLFERVIAFEPEPRNLAQLGANLLLNDLVDVVEVRPLAASDEVGSISFYVAPDENRGASRMMAEGRRDYKEEITVQAQRLDEEFDFSDRLLVFKIDVEGGEIKVLAGLEGLMSSNSCVFQIEVFGDKLAEVVSFMTGQGYQLERSIKNDRFFVAK